MSKEQFYDPQQIFSEKDIHFEDIPVFAYKKTVKEQFDSGRFTKEDLLTIWRDMRYIREFENMLLSVRTKKNFNGVEYLFRIVVQYYYCCGKSAIYKTAVVKLK